ncbi:uncharacterized protein LOC125034171 [Penaeus chinensis]|uniref:uncharacterized protein LOC125034171 n=1 Tax=Penaeus chinensis TaxID=139456 RepID=UPI001FB6200D|nr:uncharacterized protein LOC125034171 [Penaeus chinensis]
MFPRHSPPKQCVPAGYVTHAGALSRGGVPPLPFGQESERFTPSGLPFRSYQQFSGSHQVPPRPTGYPVARVSPGAPTPIDPSRVMLERYAMPQVSAEDDSDVHFLGYKRNLYNQVLQPAGTSMQPRTGNNIQEEIRQFMGVMQEHIHNMHSQTTFQSQNCSSMSRLTSAVNPKNGPCLPCHQSSDSSQCDPTQLNSKSYQQPTANTQLDAHESSEPVTDLHTTQDENALFQDQAIGDPTVSSTVNSPVSNQHEESPTINEKTDMTEKAVDARKASDVPNVLLKPPKRMFSRKGKCLSNLFRKTPRGFPHVSIDFEIYCFLCGRMAAGNNVYEHMFFGNLKCIECGQIVRSCEDFKIVRHSSVECGGSKRKHRLAYWADCPVEFLEYSVKQSLISSRTEECSPPSTSDVTTEFRKYIKKLSLLRFYKPWRSAFRRCSKYVKNMNRTEIDSVLPENTQEVINKGEVASVIPGDTEEEINKEDVNNVIPGDTEEEIKEEFNSVIQGNAQEKNNMEDVRRVFPGETQAEIDREEEEVQKDTQEEISRQEINRGTGRTTFYDLISSKSERQEEPQIEGISLYEALEHYREDSQPSAKDTVIVHPSTSDGEINQESRESIFSLPTFENNLHDNGNDINDNDTIRISNEQFEDDGDNAGTYTQDPVTVTLQLPTLWKPDGDDTHASMVEGTETYVGFQDEFSNRIAENQAYGRSFKLSERLSTKSPKPEDNQVVYYYPSETPPEECPMCYYGLCATMFTLNTTNFRVSTECPDCSLKICIVLKDAARSLKKKKPKRFNSSL